MKIQEDITSDLSIIIDTNSIDAYCTISLFDREIEEYKETKLHKSVYKVLENFIYMNWYNSNKMDLMNYR